MKYFGLLLANFRRKRMRTAFTLLAILVAFVLFGYLGAIRQAFSMGIDVTGADRLLTTNKVSIIQPLPESYKERLDGVKGVAEVTHASWFGGIYQDPKNFFPQFVVEPEEYLRMFPEFLIPERERQAWYSDRAGAIVGRVTAERFGWKVGDVIPLMSPIWQRKSGENLWTFTIRGIYDGREKGVDTTQFLFHFDYFKEGRAFGNGVVGWYMVRIADPERAAEISKRIDREFENSSWETKTATEKAWAQSWAAQIGDIGAILTGVLSAVFFTILLVAGNTVAQSVRERSSELGVLKTLGFTNRMVLLLVLAESCVLAMLGGGLGLALASWMISWGDPTGGALPIFFLPARDLAYGALLIVVLGIVTGALPAVGAMRLRIVEALRRR